MRRARHIGVFICLLLGYCVSAQSKSIDSLLQLLQNNKQDSGRIYIYYTLARHLLGYDLSASGDYLEKGYALAKEKNDAYGIARYFLGKGSLLFDQSKYRDAATYYDTSLALYEHLKKFENNPVKLEQFAYDKTDCLIGRGLVSAKLYQYQESIKYYLDAIATVEPLPGDKKNTYLSTLYADIGSDYYELEQFDNALAFDKQGLHYLSETNLESFLVGNLFVADDYSSLLQFDSSSLYLERVRPLLLRLNKPNLNIWFYYICGGIYRKKGEWANALANFQKANEVAKKLTDDYQEVNTMEGMAASYMHLGDFEKARELALLVLTESKRISLPLGRIQALQLLTEIEEKTGNIDKAYQYQKDFIQINDSLKKEKLQRHIHETEVKYETEKKQAEIIQLQKNKQIQTLSIRQKTTLNFILIGSLAIFLAVAVLIYRNLRHRQQLAKQQEALHQQRIRELEKDKQLVVADSMLKGQEEERSRLAKDLHDGLGGLLSGVKFSLINMKDNLIITPDTMAVFERSLDMLDTSIKELRRVAHNLMPEILTRFGLDEALKDYCNTINMAKLLTVTYQSFGMQARLDKSVEIVIYRIVQELLNNTLKHAAATEAFVQLLRDGTRLNVVVEDNGRGFDTVRAEAGKGAGLANIRSRVEYLKGELAIHAEAGKGTLVNIEFKL
jgi:two-component system NarL family sensor kinase